MPLWQPFYQFSYKGFDSLFLHHFYKASLANLILNYMRHKNLTDKITDKDREAMVAKYEKIFNPVSADQYHSENLKLNRLKVILSVVILLVGLLNLILQICGK